MFLFLFSVIVVILITYLIHRNMKFEKKLQYFRDCGLIAEKRDFMIMNIKDVFTSNLTDVLQRLYKKYENERVIGVADSLNYNYFIRDATLARQIAVKDFEYFMNHSKFIDPDMDPMFGNQLINLEGKRWRNLRVALTPAFTGSKMRLMFQLIQQCSDNMKDYLWDQYKLNGAQVYDIKDMYSKFTNDAIVSCAFGVKCDTFREPNNEFYRMVKRVLNFMSLGSMIKLIICSIFKSKFVAKLLNFRIIDALSQSVFTDIIVDAMKIREEKHIYRPDMINLMMDLKKGDLKTNVEREVNRSIATAEDHLNILADTKQTWTDDDLIPQSFVFLFAGSDTSSTVMAFAAYELAVNRDIQDILLYEIDKTNEALSGKPLDYDHLQSMIYLDMVVTETMRKWPPLGFVERHCEKDYKYEEEGGFKLTITKGSSVVFPIFSMQRDAQYFPDPDKFYPERFSIENRDSNNMNAYAPFGLGPRNCIGSRFALMQTKSALYHVLLKFTFEVCDKTKIPIKLKRTLFGIVPENMQLLLKPRLTSQ